MNNWLVGDGVIVVDSCGGWENSSLRNRNPVGAGAALDEVCKTRR
jgi:hypothetical protein